jgi:riboflavin kinase/FMN adenylyltransferase
MKVFRGFHHPGIAPACALTIGNFDGVHRGHQAMLALLRGEAQQRGVPSCVLTFEPHPRDYFAAAVQKPDLAPGTCGHAARQARRPGQLWCRPDRGAAFRCPPGGQSPQPLSTMCWSTGLGARYVLVGDDFRFGASARATMPCWTLLVM